MTTSNWISRRVFATAVLLISALPASALAAVHITGVMYDPAGADPGREWIQITNTGTSTLALAGYRLYEGGINHKLAVAAGTSTLAANAEAIIATDPGQYMADHPSFGGTVFKSSFSLSNTGETIELKDPTLVVVDTYRYTAPPVVKTPPPAKITKAPKSVTSAKSSSYAYAGNNQAAAAPLALPAVPALPKVWLYVLGTVSLLALGAVTVLYVRQPAVSTATSSPEEEFELE